MVLSTEYFGSCEHSLHVSTLMSFWYYKLMFLMKLHYSIFKVLLNAVFHIQCPSSQPLQSTSVQEKHRSTNNVIIYSLLLLNVADV